VGEGGEIGLGGGDGGSGDGRKKTRSINALRTLTQIC
jgi:hypothetical protein